MLAHRKTGKESQQAKLRKSNALKMKQKNMYHPQVLKRQQENALTVHFTQRNTGRIDANNFNYHFASSSELIYTPFRKDYYLPPHLNSLNIQRTLFRSESPQWKVRASSTKKYDYDQLYYTNEKRYEGIGSIRRWSGVKSKIKSLLDEDRTSHQFFHNHSKLKCCKRQKHPDDDLSEQSSLQPQQP